MVRELLIFLRYWFQLFRHAIARFNLSKGFKFSVLLALGIFFILFDFFFFWRVISQVVGMTELDKLRFSFIIRLLNLLNILFVGMVLFSNIVTALSTFFLSKDLVLLMSSPIRLGTIFFHKFLETYLNSSWMVILFGLPIFIAYGVALDAKGIFYALLPLILIPYLLIPASLGLMVTMLLMRFFPAKRTHQVIASMGVFFGAGIVVVVRLLRPEEFIQPISADRLEIYDNLLRIPSAPLLPSTWISEAVMKAIEGKWAEFLPYFILLWLTGIGLVYLAFLLAKSIYRTAYSRSQEGGSPNPRIVIRRHRFWESALQWLSPQMAGFFIKDVKVFIREATQWSQLFLLAAIVFIYLFNIRNIPVYSWFLSNFACFLNVGMAGFVQAALCARFVFPAVSIEGNAFWIVRSAPVNYRRFVLVKFLFYLLPLLLLGEMLVVVSNHFLKVDPYMQALTMVLIFFITLTNVGLGVGLGSLFPRFNVENAAQIAVGAGGILYMIVTLGFLLSLITLEAWPVYFHFQGLLGAKYSFRQSLPYHLIAMTLSLLLTVIPPMLGVRSLRAVETEET
jgi:ABC-2 type transport system permease protein